MNDSSTSKTQTMLKGLLALQIAGLFLLLGLFFDHLRERAKYEEERTEYREEMMKYKLASEKYDAALAEWNKQMMEYTNASLTKQ
jgi:hypothetical protein